MNKTKKIAFSALMAAAATVIMLTSYFPYLTYAIPGIASLAVLVVQQECGARWGWLTFLVSALLIFLTAEPESKLLYIAFLGYYPILRGWIERIRLRPLRVIVKFAAFNAAAVLFYYLSLFLISADPADFTMGLKYGILLFALLANVTFFVFDFALGRLILLYWFRFHETVRKFLK